MANFSVKAKERIMYHNIIYIADDVFVVAESDLIELGERVEILGETNAQVQQRVQTEPYQTMQNTLKPYVVEFDGTNVPDNENRRLVAELPEECRRPCFIGWKTYLKNGNTTERALYFVDRPPQLVFTHSAGQEFSKVVVMMYYADYDNATANLIVN